MRNNQEMRAPLAPVVTRRMSKRIFVTAIAMIALAAAPCAWDTDPRELPAIASLFADVTPRLDRRAAQTVPVPDNAPVTASLVVEPSPEISNR
jgi:hypothetical protein